MSFFLFPGQGSQRPGMGRDFYDASPAAREVFDEAAAMLSPDFLESVFHGTPEELNHTRTAQPALLTVEVAIARHLAAHGLEPSGAAGHSLGEISALVVAGACNFGDALRFTRERARLMSEEVPAGGMAAVMGLEADAIEAALPGGVQVANYNGPSQTIISGNKTALADAEARLKEAGAKRCIMLPVSGPFHSEYMRSAAQQFEAVLQSVEFRAPAIGFISSVTGGAVYEPEFIRGMLAAQLYSPVRWTQVMREIPGERAFEVGPGNVLKGLAKRMEGVPEVVAIGTVEEAAAYTK